MPEPELLALRPQGLYCAAGDFFIDPWRPVDRALITHAHADHARTGHRRYLASAESLGVLGVRLGPVSIQGLAWGEPITIGGVTVSFHPAGHILGSAQIRLAHRGRVWVVSGDYKVEPDPTCTAFEPVRCDTFVTESTFGLPVYRWQPQREIMAAIDRWWSANAADGRASILYCYSLGKAQRILNGVDASIGPIVCHSAILPLNRVYQQAGVRLPAVLGIEAGADPAVASRALVLAPPASAGSPGLRRFTDPSDAFASGWMQLRGARRRRAVDRGFVLSDHADWPGLQQAIEASGAARVLVTHGQVAPLVRWLGEQGRDAAALQTRFGEGGDDAEGGDAVGEALPADAPAPRPLIDAAGQWLLTDGADGFAPPPGAPGKG
jgi:putative mRNA 3-end processing factor